MVGGLSAKPHLAKQLDLFVRPEEVLKVAIGTTIIYRKSGLQGALVKTPNEMVDAFDIAVGGILGPGARFNQALKGRKRAIRSLQCWSSYRGPEESFHQFMGRVGSSTLYIATRKKRCSQTSFPA